MVFPSKIDTWLLLVLLSSVAVALAACVYVLMTVVNTTSIITVLITGLLGIALPAWLLLSTYYTIADGELKIRSGPFHWTVPLNSIRAIEPTRNPLSSPALSLDRLAISYGNGKTIMVSPKDPGAFINATGIDQ